MASMFRHFHNFRTYNHTPDAINPIGLINATGAILLVFTNKLFTSLYFMFSCYKCFADEATLLDHIPKHKESKHLKVHNFFIFLF